MVDLASLRHSRRFAIVVVSLAVMLATAGIAAAAPSSLTFTPQKADQITNLDILRTQIESYYGDPGKTGVIGANSNYAMETTSVAAAGERWLKAKAGKSTKQAIVLDVDDTTLATWNYELYSNWAYNFASVTASPQKSNADFVTGQLFPPVPGMVAMVKQAAKEGYAVFWITGRPTAQYAATLGNLTSDGIGVDAGYPTPTTIDRSGAGDVGPGLFTKPTVGSYPAYLNKPEFCASAIAAAKSCATVPYKSGTRAYIESLGYDIVADFGDQFSDLNGGFADNTFKLPNPNYYLP